MGSDEQADRANHGGRDQAVYAYAREELDLWEGWLGRSLRDGVFGENLTTSGLEVSRALIGERWRIGSTLLEVTLPRIPCGVFRSWLDEKGWVRRFTEEARTGAYLRVVEEGVVEVGAPITVEYRPDHDISLSGAFQALHNRDLELLHRVLAIPGRSESWVTDVASVERKLGR
ncbi:MOSC domain-containing protein [Lipingzhangella sp. LS1_29]|uniref:MOSC domain-containing protein n=1 Tax=Lipingzhangella rawalii TaxID=2055835 RepID=A0ABU2H995_9ACTN|nr:MOSC domain-containing protein [Lipingzhangella rawalii]MDS1271174.1 MOSC domain-containing protein [Lipingzhangella rawalii]